MLIYVAIISFIAIIPIALTMLIIEIVRKKRFSEFVRMISLIMPIVICLILHISEETLYSNCSKETITEKLGEYDLKEYTLMSDNNKINNAAYILENVCESNSYSFQYIDENDKKPVKTSEDRIKITITDSAYPHVVVYENKEVPTSKFVYFLIYSSRIIPYRTYEIYVPTGTLLSFQ